MSREPRIKENRAAKKEETACGQGQANFTSKRVLNNVLWRGADSQASGE
jgi:hypothetical protein